MPKQIFIRFRKLGFSQDLKYFFLFSVIQIRQFSFNGCDLMNFVLFIDFCWILESWNLLNDSVMCCILKLRSLWSLFVFNLNLCRKWSLLNEIWFSSCSWVVKDLFRLFFWIKLVSLPCFYLFSWHRKSLGSLAARLIDEISSEVVFNQTLRD